MENFIFCAVDMVTYHKLNTKWWREFLWFEKSSSPNLLTTFSNLLCFISPQKWNDKKVDHFSVQWTPQGMKEPTYRKGFSTQLALLSLTEKWKKALHNKGFERAVLMDLFKVFDTIKHDLIAKLHAYGFDKSSLKLLFSYLNNRWHRTKIN